MYFKVMFFVILFAQPVASNEIITVAGNGTAGFSGDGQQATTAQLDRPTAVTADSLGNIYVVDGNNARIRKIDLSGMITTIAGAGEGFSGDGGPATLAQINRPHGIATSRDGSLYIADTRNHRIRKIDNSGIIATIAGSGTGGFSGDGGPATQAQINRPHGIATDPEGNVYFADTNNGRIRKIDISGTITTIVSDLNGPASVGVASNNNLYVTERNGNRILKIDATGAATPLAGNGMLGFSEDGTPATQGRLGGPRGIAVAPTGTVYFSDKENQRVRSLSKEGTLTTIAGKGTRGDSGDNGLATNASLNFPWGLCVDNKGRLYIADRENHRIRLVTFAVQTSAPSPDFNADQRVDFQDFLLFISHFGTDETKETFDAKFDLNSDTKIDFTDFILFAQAFGT